MYFSGQGKVYIATPVAGVPGVFRYVGNVPSLEINFETDTLEHKEATSGQRLTDLRLSREKKASLKMTLEEFDKNNLALALYGVAADIGAGSVTAEVFPNPVAVGDFVRLAKQKVSSVVIEDSAGTPATLVLDTDYRIESADHGLIEILNIGAYTQPFKADYSHALVANINMFTAPAPERWIRFQGLNTADNNKSWLIELYKAAMDPLANLALITDELASLELSGSVLYDSTKTADATLGTFGRMVQI